MNKENNLKKEYSFFKDRDTTIFGFFYFFLGAIFLYLSEIFKISYGESYFLGSIIFFISLMGTIESLNILFGIFIFFLGLFFTGFFILIFGIPLDSLPSLIIGSTILGLVSSVFGFFMASLLSKNN